MQKYHYFTLFSLFAVTSIAGSAEQLSLPRSLHSRAVYYIRTKQLDSFSCGYNVLFNAANFEHVCGFSNPVHKYAVFKNKCLPYIRSRGCNPKDTSTNSMTEHLAQTTLRLQPFYHLCRDKNRIVPLLTGETRISYRAGTSERKVKRLFKQAISRRHQKVIANIKEYLASQEDAVVHFLCYIQSALGGRHGVLLSVCQNETGRGLYLFDNINEKLRSSSDIIDFIEYLCNTFSISKRLLFVGPKLPNRWPHLDRRARPFRW